MPSFARMRRLPVLLLGLVLLFAAGAAVAAPGDGCPELAARQQDPQVATRIGAVACAESLRWNRPFIDTEGRLASLNAYEAEDRGLQDGGAPWRRVAFYWQASGLLPGMAFKPGAGDCQVAAMRLEFPGLGCRAFVVDTPWSAAFVSWVMQRAGVPGFRASASHADYVRAALRDPASSPYRLQAPQDAQLQAGDLLCYARAGQVLGPAGLRKLLEAGNGGVPMHCDVVVSREPGRVYLVGGNVQQAVTLRILQTNAAHRLWNLPQRAEGDLPCSPDMPQACDFNRQDWVAALVLRPQEELAGLGAVTPPAPVAEPPSAPTCCVNCVLGSGVPRCPLPGQAPPRRLPEVPLQGAE